MLVTEVGEQRSGLGHAAPGLFGVETTCVHVDHRLGEVTVRLEACVGGCLQLPRPGERFVLTAGRDEGTVELEERFEASLRDSMAQPDQQDLLELRLNSARLAAELSRVTIELRAEINELASNRSDDVIDLTAISETGQPIT